MRIAEKAIEVLAAALPTAVSIVNAGSKDLTDVSLRLGRETYPVQIAWAGAGYPRDLERVLPGVGSDNTPLIVVAEEFSVGSRQILAAADVSWVTAGGDARIDVGGILVSKERVEPRNPSELKLGWTDARVVIAETLLGLVIRRTPDDQAEMRVPPVQILAERAARSVGSVSTALLEFDRRGWTRRVGAERGQTAIRIVETPGELLDAWSDHYETTRELTTGFHTLERDPFAIARMVAEVLPEAYFGGRMAAEMLAGHSTQIGTLRCYVPDAEWRDAAKRLAAAGFSATADVGGRLVIAYGEAHLTAQVEVAGGMRVTPPIRTYGDLLREPVRGREAAQFLRETTIGF